MLVTEEEQGGEEYANTFRDLEVCGMYTGASLVAQSIKNSPAVQETGAPSLGPEDPLEKEMECVRREKRREDEMSLMVKSL